MATASTKNGAFAPDLETAAESVREASDRMVEAARRVTNAYLDGVEKYGVEYAQAGRKLAKQAQGETFASLFDAHATMTEDVITATVSAARELIAA
jgi:hypothetical protein